MSLFTQYLHGRCPGCQSIYRWPLEQPLLRLQNAICKDCNLSLTRAAGRAIRGPAVQDVDPEWLRRQTDE